MNSLLTGGLREVILAVGRVAMPPSRSAAGRSSSRWQNLSCETVGLVSTTRQLSERPSTHEGPTGFAQLAATMDLLLPELHEIYCEQILRECSLRIREFGKDRLEYPILSVISLAACARS